MLFLRNNTFTLNTEICVLQQRLCLRSFPRYTVLKSPLSLQRATQQIVKATVTRVAVLFSEGGEMNVRRLHCMGTDVLCRRTHDPLLFNQHRCSPTPSSHTMFNHISPLTPYNALYQTFLIFLLFRESSERFV